MVSRKVAGVTLIEVMIVAVILAIILLVTMFILFDMSSTVSDASVNSNLEERARNFLQYCNDDLSYARFTGLVTVGAGVYNLGIYSDSTEIRYQIAGVDNSSPPPILNPIVYGYLDPNATTANIFRQGLACFLRFEAHTALRESSTASATSQATNLWSPPLPGLPALTSEIVNMDIDRDGTRTGTFVLGRIRRYVVAPNGTPLGGAAGALLHSKTLSENVLLRVTSSGVFNGDVDGNAATPDLLYRFVDANGVTLTNALGQPINAPTVATTSVAVAVTHGNFYDFRRKYSQRRATDLIKLRNIQ